MFRKHRNSKDILVILLIFSSIFIAGCSSSSSRFRKATLYHHRKANAYCEEGDFQSALNLYQKYSMELSSDDSVLAKKEKARVLYLISEVYQALDNGAESRKYANQSLSLWVKTGGEKAEWKSWKYAKYFERITMTFSEVWKRTNVFLEKGDTFTVIADGNLNRAARWRGIFVTEWWPALKPKDAIRGKIGENGKAFNMISDFGSKTMQAKARGRIMLGFPLLRHTVMGEILDPSYPTPIYKGKWNAVIIVWKSSDPTLRRKGIDELYKIDQNDRLLSLAKLDQLLTLVESLKAKGRHTESLNHLLEAISILQNIDDNTARLELAKAYRDLATLYKRIKEPEKSLKYTRLTLRTLLGFNQDYPVLQNLTDEELELVVLKLNFLDRYNEPTHRMLFSTKYLGNIYCGLGDYYLKNGEVHKALEYFMKAREKAESTAIKGWAQAWEALSYLILGDPEKAKETNREISNIRGMDLYARLYPDVKALMDTGLLLTAFVEKLSAIKTSIREDTFDATEFQELNEYAEYMILQARRGSSRAIAHCVKAFLLAGEKKYRQAREHVNKAMAISKKRIPYKTFCMDFSNLSLSYVYLSQARYHEAIEAANEIGKTYDTVELLASWFKYMAYLKLGDQDGAYITLNEGIKKIEETRSKVGGTFFKMVFFGFRQDLYEEMIAFLIDKPGKEEEAFDFAERARARAFLDLIASRHIMTKSEKTEDLNNRLKELQDKINELQEKIDLQTTGDVSLRDISIKETSELRELKRYYNEIVVQMKESDIEFASLRAVNPFKSGEIQSFIDNDVTIVEYFVSEKTLFAWVLDKEKIRATKIPISKKDLSEKIDIYRKNLTDPKALRGLKIVPKAKIQMRDISEVSQELYNIVIKPLLPFIKHEKICFVPHNVLHYLPFQSLADGNRYIIEDYAIFYSPSATVLKFAMDKRRENRGKILAFGNPELGDPIYSLPFAQKEVEGIKKIYRDAQIYVKNEATENKAKSLSGDYDMLHFATHGELNQEFPMLSGLLLAKGNGEDGRLEAHEIFSMDLKSSLITLSACKTALGKLSKGDEIVGLTRAFIYAGTPSIIGSLWSVNDKATQIFMDNFYSNLKTMPKSLALQAAQTYMIDSCQYSAPFYWAAFKLDGDWK